MQHKRNSEYDTTINYTTFTLTNRIIPKLSNTSS